MSRAAKAALVYLALQWAVIIAVNIHYALVTAPDASFAGIWAIVATLPGSLLVVQIWPDLSAGMASVLLGAVALVQAGLLYGVIRALSRR